MVGSTVGEWELNDHDGQRRYRTTTPAARLEIVGTLNPLMISSTATGAGDYLIVGSSGRVGIGTTLAAPGTGLSVMNGNVGIGTWSPAQRLHVDGSIQSSQVLLTSDGTGALIKSATDPGNLTITPLTPGYYLTFSQGAMGLYRFLSGIQP